MTRVLLRDYSFKFTAQICSIENYLDVIRTISMSLAVKQLKSSVAPVAALWDLEWRNLYELLAFGTIFTFTASIDLCTMQSTVASQLVLCFE